MASGDVLYEALAVPVLDVDHSKSGGAYSTEGAKLTLGTFPAYAIDSLDSVNVTPSVGFAVSLAARNNEAVPTDFLDPTKKYNVTITEA